MDYKHWCKFLEPELLLKWEVELIMQQRVYDIGRVDNLRTFNSFNDFINYTLTWSETKDGQEFWSRICNTEPYRLIDHTDEQRRYFYGL